MSDRISPEISTADRLNGESDLIEMSDLRSYDRGSDAWKFCLSGKLLKLASENKKEELYNLREALQIGALKEINYLETSEIINDIVGVSNKFGFVLEGYFAAPYLSAPVLRKLEFKEDRRNVIISEVSTYNGKLYLRRTGMFIPKVTAVEWKLWVSINASDLIRTLPFYVGSEAMEAIERDIVNKTPLNIIDDYSEVKTLYDDMLENRFFNWHPLR